MLTADARIDIPDPVRGDLVVQTAPSPQPVINVAKVDAIGLKAVYGLP